jgi:predicted PurR-regulated permease PerM
VASSSTEWNPQRTYKTIAAAVAITILAVLLCVAVYQARTALLIVYISMLLAMGFGPVVHAIEHQRRIPIGTPRVPRWLAILVVYVAIVSVVMSIGVLVVPPLAAQARDLSDRIPHLADRFQAFLIDRGVLDHRVTLEEAVRNTPASPGSAVGTVASAVGWTVKMFLAIITILVLTFYLLVERDALLSGFVRLFPRENRSRVLETSRKISGKVSAWLSGQLILAGSIGATAAIGEMIPVVGPLMSAVPAILVGLSVSPKTALFVAIFWIVQQQLENHLLVPKIMQRQLGISPVVIIIALLVGGSVLGIIGALLAVPTAAIIQVVVQELIEEREERSGTLRPVRTQRSTQG